MQQHRFSKGQRGRWWGVGSMAMGLLTSCLYDADKPCGPNQSLDDALGVCVCEEGYAFSEEGCVACGKNEVAGPAGCGCKSGFARDSEGVCQKPQAPPPAAPTPAPACEADGGCADAEVGAGECESDAGCMDAQAPPPSEGCESDDDCEEGEFCKPSTGACMVPPQGVGTMCDSDDDCAATDATFCDPTYKICIVQGCTFEPDSCFVGSECCDVGAPKPLCVLEGYCEQ